MLSYSCLVYAGCKVVHCAAEAEFASTGCMVLDNGKVLRPDLRFITSA